MRANFKLTKEEVKGRVTRLRRAAAREGYEATRCPDGSMLFVGPNRGAPWDALAAARIHKAGGVPLPPYLARVWEYNGDD